MRGTRSRTQEIGEASSYLRRDKSWMMTVEERIKIKEEKKSIFYTSEFRTGEEIGYKII